MITSLTDPCVCLTHYMYNGTSVNGEIHKPGSINMLFADSGYYDSSYAITVSKASDTYYYKLADYMKGNKCDDYICDNFVVHGYICDTNGNRITPTINGDKICYTHTYDKTRNFYATLMKTPE